MTAVAVQHRDPRQQPQYYPRQSPRSSLQPSPHTSRPQSNNNTPPPPAQPQGSGVDTSSNGVYGAMNHRSAVSNDPSRNSTPSRAANQSRSRELSRASVIRNGEPSSVSPSGANGVSDASEHIKGRRQSDQTRPTSAPGGPAAALVSASQRDTATDDSEREMIAKRPKSFLHRSKSDFGPRGDESDSQRHDSDNQDWGARHGFEDHYASEEYVSQLANVRLFFPSVCPFLL
jgi:regulatory associated protein of mTOR